ncbi:MAG: ABC transporter substrate-binding protein [Bdellovibrio sp.]|nr:ABC transporter substrate-binding protein [Bdellovibrio sp.]
MNEIKLPLALVVFFALLFSACTKSPYSTAVLGKPVTTFDPVTGEINEVTILSQICGRLTSLDDYLNLEGDLAEKWTVSPDRKTYHFDLVKGRKFLTGEELTADDIVFSIERMTGAKDSLAKEWMNEVSSVESVDQYSLLIKLKEANPRFLFTLSHPRFCILHKTKPFIESSGVQVPNSSGAYKITKYIPENSEYILEVTPAFSERAIEKKISVRFLEQKAALSEYSKGHLDDLSFYLINSNEAADLRKSSRVLKAKIYWTWVIVLNPKQAIFSQIETRRYFFSHLNKTDFLRLWNSSMDVSNSMIPRGMKGFYDFDNSIFQNNILKSKAPDCPETGVRIAVISGMPNEKELTDALNLEVGKALNCKIKISFLEMGEYLTELVKGSFDIYLHGIDTNSNDPAGFFRDFSIHSSENFFGIRNEKFEKVFTSLYSTAQELRGPEAYETVQKSIGEMSLILPLGHPNFDFFYQKSVTKIHMNPLGMHLNRWFEIGRQ